MRKLIIIPLLLISILLQGTDYYVKTAGDDANTGLSDAQAFKTIHQITAHTALIAGDNVYFNRGDTWKEKFVIAQSGSFGSVITFAAYGTGVKPIITVRDTITGWSRDGNWTNVSGNIWYKGSEDYKNYRLWIDGVEKSPSQTSSVSATNQFYYDAGNTRLYVYSVGNPGVVCTIMEVPFVYINPNYANITVSTNSKDYLTFSNLDIQGGALAFKVVNSDYITIDNCNVGNSSVHGVKIESGTTSLNSNNGVISNCTFDTGLLLSVDFWTDANEAADGILLQGGSNNWLIYNNTFKNWLHAAMYVYNITAGYYAANNKIYNNYFTNPDIQSGRGLGVDCLTGQCDDLQIYNNVVYNTPSANQINGDGILFHDNIINEVRGHIGRPTVHGGCLLISGYAVNITDSKYYNNTIANCWSYGLQIETYGTYSVANNVFSNNLIYNNDDDTDYQIYLEDDAYVTSQTFKNNLLFKTGVTDLVYYGHSATNDYPHTIAEFNAETGTAGDVISGNIGGDPLWVDDTNDTLSIGAGSPAIDAGIDVDLPFDMFGHVRGIIPDIGSVEYGALLPARTLKSKQGKYLMSKGKRLVIQ